MPPPKDPYHIVYILFYLMSIGTLLPWNFFINVNGYWMYKFRTVHNNTDNGSVDNQKNVMSNNKENVTILDGEAKNELQLDFTADLAIAAQIPNVAVLILNGIYGHRFKTTPRLLVSLVVVVLMFVVTLVFVEIDTDTWQTDFFVITLITTVIINAASAVFQGGFRGVAGIFPPAYMNGVLSGMAVGGIFTAAINILFLAVGGDDVAAAFYCFMVAVALLTLCFIAFLFVTRSPFYKYYTREAVEPHSDETSPLITPKPDSPPEISVLNVLCTLWKYNLSILLVYIVSLCCFPALTVLIESTEMDSPDSTAWHNTYFVPVACFLFFNIGDYLGRLAASFQLPHPGPSLTLVLSFSRFAFLPLFLICNASPSSRQLTPVLIHSDAVYIILMWLFSVSNGYLTSVCFVAAPQAVQPHLQLTAANLMVSVLGVGLVLGSAGSAALVQLL